MNKLRLEEPYIIYNKYRIDAGENVSSVKI